MAPHADNGHSVPDGDKPSNIAPLEPGIPKAVATEKMPKYPG